MSCGWYSLDDPVPQGPEPPASESLVVLPLDLHCSFPQTMRPKTDTSLLEPLQRPPCSEYFPITEIKALNEQSHAPPEPPFASYQPASLVQEQGPAQPLACTGESSTELPYPKVSVTNVFRQGYVQLAQRPTKK